jgi:hypothetical protein
LVKLWKLIGPGTLLQEWDLYIASPGQSVTFTSDEIYGEYQGSSKLIGLSAIKVGQLWFGTDSHTRIFELSDGPDVGKLVGFCYGDNCAYKSTKGVQRLLDFISQTLIDIEPSEVSSELFKELFAGASLTDEKESDNGKSGAIVNSPEY